MKEKGVDEMAGTNRRKTSTSTNRKRTTKTSNRSTQSKRSNSRNTAQDSALFHEIGLIVLFVVMVLLFFCNFGMIGPVGNSISKFLFGVFGFSAYFAPILIFFALAFWFANEGNPSVVRKMIAGFVLFLMFGVVCDLLSHTTDQIYSYSLKAVYEASKEDRAGGGILAGSISYFLRHYFETIGTVLVVFLLSVISIILMTEKSILNTVKDGSNRVMELSREDAERRRELNRARALEQEELRNRRADEKSKREEERRAREEERKRKEEELENERILRMEKKVSGVMVNPTVTKPAEKIRRNDIHEITYEEGDDIPEEELPASAAVPAMDFDKVRIHTGHKPAEKNAAELRQNLSASMVKGIGDGEDVAAAPVKPAVHNARPVETARSERTGASTLHPSVEQNIKIHKDGITDHTGEPAKSVPVNSAMHERPVVSAPKSEMEKAVSHNEKAIPKTYMFPPLSRLTKGVASTTDSTAELKETAMRLQQTLNTFGVRVTITDISQGPSVTRYELQPEQGVKVSKIVNLADDIKLNLAATDIRIEAPIPGKAAIGIEVPNKENMAVALRDLLEAPEFQNFDSKIAFAVGKDIAGKVVVTDIGKMPHMLIAGATGSGKSVCINTLIMSILYKAHPDDVKLIMIDPKVVELSVYNGIPHLLIPVVTDPKKASAALHWGVSEMEDRYRKFADFNVRDLKGYNKKVEQMQESGDEEAPKKMPQIVIIVDELADLMMVSPGEVEESICRLAQLARAAGIHLIIATQRPSVDVITGLIKANMPSRVAFSVSSGVDSRTILDMNGAEKLLGKGDMLFYPQGYTKPARIQGAFVSDKEVSDVVDFLKNQIVGNVYSEDVEEKLKAFGSGGGAGGGSGKSDSQLDELFEKAGRFIIEKDKASIGMLQRVLSVGFNRAARIMDQLCEYGVVGEEEGTKPRKILMSPEQFEQLIEEIL